MMDPAFKHWLTAVHAHAQTHLMAIPVYQPSSDPIDYYNLAFWSQVPPSPIDIQSNARTQADINAATFFRYASDAQKEEMGRCQQKALEKLITDILAIEDDLFSHLQNLQVAYNIAPVSLGYRGNIVLKKDFIPKELLVFILNHPQLFSNKKSLEPITKIDAILNRVALESTDVNSPIDFFWRVNNYFVKNYNSYVQPGKFDVFLQKNFPDTYEKIFEVLRAGYRPNTSKIMVEPIDPEKIKISFDISSVFAEESARLGPKGSRETGGRAGWGAQKPDLWKP